LLNFKKVIFKVSEIKIYKVIDVNVNAQVKKMYSARLLKPKRNCNCLPLGICVVLSLLLLFLYNNHKNFILCPFPAYNPSVHKGILAMLSHLMKNLEELQHQNISRDN